MNRLQQIAAHVIASVDTRGSLAAIPTSASMSSAAKSDDDVVICCALRTAITKAKKGGFKDTPPEDLLAPLFRAVVDKTKIDPKAIGDIQIGNVLQGGGGAMQARMGQFLGGLPFDVPLAAVNRQCSSGLQAVANIAGNIKSGVIDVGLAGGVESMSIYTMAESLDPSKLSSTVGTNDLAMACMVPMGITSENVAEKWNIGRDRQDSMAADSHAKALAAQKAG